VKRLFSVLCLSLGLLSCGYDGGYRYPCQDPENWENEECNPPICKVDGACTEDLLGYDPSSDTSPEESVLTEETTTP
jgi:hypothetical protein